MDENGFLFVFSSLAIRLERFEVLSAIGNLYSCAIYYYPIYIGEGYFRYKDEILYVIDSYSKFHECDAPVNMENLLVDDYLIGAPANSQGHLGYLGFLHTDKGIRVSRERAKKLMSGDEESLITVLGGSPLAALNKAYQREILKDVKALTYKETFITRKGIILGLDLLTGVRSMGDTEPADVINTLNEGGMIAGYAQVFPKAIKELLRIRKEGWI